VDQGREGHQKIRNIQEAKSMQFVARPKHRGRDVDVDMVNAIIDEFAQKILASVNRSSRRVREVRIWS
jgi:hypothetical protein